MKKTPEFKPNIDRLVRSAMCDERYCSFILDCLQGLFEGCRHVQEGQPYVAHVSHYALPTALLSVTSPTLLEIFITI